MKDKQNGLLDRGREKKLMFKMHLLDDAEESLTSEKYMAEKAFKLLKTKIQQIRNVNEWAELMGCSRSWLGRYIKAWYGVAPKTMIKKVRYDTIVEIIENHHAVTSCHTAELAGLPDDKALYKFLNNYYETNFTELRYKILNGFMQSHAYLQATENRRRKERIPGVYKWDTKSTNGIQHILDRL